MIEFALCVVAFVLLLLGVVAMVGRVDYRITSTHLEVRLLGVCLRKLDLTDIVRVSKHRNSVCEAWPNTLLTRKRTLVIKRRTGWMRCFLITPEHRYAFKHRLKQAMARARGDADIPDRSEAEGLSEADEDELDD